MLITGLAFSGGKDSWTCLWLNEEKLKDILVIWIDTGKNYPEMLETIKLAEKMCPNFVRVSVDREGQNAYHGIPADLVPIQYTRQGHLTCGVKEVLIQSYLQCCYENIAVNLMSYCHKKGITSLIIGQRNEEEHKSTSRDGDITYGIKRIQPIEQWSEQQVMQFLNQKMELLPHFSFKHSSMDCYDCTAYKKETRDIRLYRAVHFPALEAEFQKRNRLLHYAIDEAMKD